MKSILLLFGAIALLSCNRESKIDLQQFNLKDLKGNEVNLHEIAGDSFVVFIFMSPDCPLCISYTKTLNDLYAEFSKRGVAFISVYPGKYYRAGEVMQFESEYHLTYRGVLDPALELTRKLHATITPEVIIVSPQGEKVYSGAIDNWMYETGKKRTIITEKYLETAIYQLLTGSTPDPLRTEAVGCYIEL